MGFKKELSSGAVLEFDLAPFLEAEELFQVFTGELKPIKLEKDTHVVTMYKDAIFTLMSSKNFRAAIWVCLKRALYNGQRVTEKTFEPQSAREDYLACLYEVAKENLAPFTKDLYARFGHIFQEGISEPTQI